MYGYTKAGKLHAYTKAAIHDPLLKPNNPDHTTPVCAILSHNFGQYHHTPIKWWRQHDARLDVSGYQGAGVELRVQIVQKQTFTLTLPKIQ